MYFKYLTEVDVHNCEYWNNYWTNYIKLNYNKDNIDFINFLLDKNIIRSNVLILGSGIGCEDLILLQRGFNVVSVDFSRVAINNLLNYVLSLGLKRLHKGYCLDIRHELTRFSDNSFNTVCANNVLTYLDDSDLIKVLEQMYRVSKDYVCIAFMSDQDTKFTKGICSSNFVVDDNGIARRYFNIDMLESYLYYYRIREYFNLKIANEEFIIAILRK
jgi:ubiquinone/menaquinone biosynthesis C-methylase UbiE